MGKYSLFSVCTSPYSVRAILWPKLEGLSRAGFSVTAISSPDPNAAVDVPEGVKFVPVFIPRTISPFADIAAFFKLWQLFREHNPNIVHTRTAKAGFLGRIAAYFAGVPVIIHTTHGLPFYPGQGRIKYFLYRTLERISTQFCDLVLSQNHEDLQRLIDENVAPASKSGYEGNGVNVAAIRQDVSEQKTQKVLEEFGLKDGELLIVSVSRLEPVKRLDRLLEVLSKISTHTKWKCLIVGHGPLDKKLRGISRNLGTDDKVCFTGWRDDVWAILNAADIVVLASDKEGVPRSIMEAMALAKPVVATDVLGTSELVRKGQTGILKAVDDIGGLVHAIERFLNDETLRSKFGKAGAKVVESEFDEKYVLERLISFYKKLLKQKNVLLARD